MHIPDLAEEAVSHCCPLYFPVDGANDLAHQLIELMMWVRSIWAAGRGVGGLRSNQSTVFRSLDRAAEILRDGSARRTLLLISV
jgi:hypothetical protein